MTNRLLSPAAVRRAARHRRMLALTATAAVAVGLGASPGVAAAEPGAVLPPSKALSVRFSDTSSFVVEPSTSSEMREVPGSEIALVVGRAGEERRVAFQMPSRLSVGGSGTIDRAMATWSVRCSPSTLAQIAGDGAEAAGATRTAVVTKTTAAGTPTIGVRGFVRNLLDGEKYTATVRTLVEFSAPGTYRCVGLWGARNPGASAGDRVAQVGEGALWVSAPVDATVESEQCYWPDKAFEGGKPEDCYYSSAPTAGSNAERVEVGDAPLRVNKVRTTVAAPTATAPGAWMLAQASIGVTTCGGQQEGTSPCRVEDRWGGSAFAGSITLRDSADNPYPAACVQVDADDDGRQSLTVSQRVHHDHLQFTLRFRIKPGCSPDVRVSSFAGVTAEKPGWVLHKASHLTVSVETP